MKKCLLSFPVFIFFCFSAFSQSSVIVRNSTWQQFEVSVQQYGTHILETNEWSQLLSNAKAWKEGDSEVFQTNRDAASIPENDTVYFDIKLSGEEDTLTIMYRIIGVSGGSALAYSIRGPGFSEPWQTDGSFHELQTTLYGKNVVIKYKPNNDDSGMSRDVVFAIHDLPVYELVESEFSNPNILNIMAYNIQMLPLGISGMGQANDRSDYLPSNLSPWQDVVIYAEVFDNGPRNDHLIPAMQAAGFSYKTGILNDQGNNLVPSNGGIMIFSRWPIEAEDEIEYSACGPNASDCLARKGMKYALVNKLGKKYHVFGTHMDAGSQPEDIAAKHIQIGEIRQFIEDVDIPTTEAVVFGGDFNISPDDEMYLRFIDTLNPVIPYPIGDDDSNFSDEPGNIIDHIWVDSHHLLPLEATNKVITVRSLEPVLWDLSEFSDHRAVLGRFVYPDVLGMPGDTVLCPHENLTMTVSSDPLYPFQWKKDGTVIQGETGNSYSLTDVSENESGLYQCTLSYEVTYGDDSSNTILPYFYPNGPRTFQSESAFDFNVVVDSVLCLLSVDNKEIQGITVYPNPNEGFFVINNPTNNNALLEIYSATGALVFNSTLGKGMNNIELKQQTGIYFLVVMVGEKRMSEKLIIH